MSEPLTTPYDPKVPTREQLAKFLPDHESIRFFERLFQVAGTLTPSDIEAIYTILDEVELTAGIANTKAVEALDKITRLEAKSQKSVSVDSNYSALIGNYSIFADATAGAVTVTLPLAKRSKDLIIGTTKLDISSNIVTIQRSGTDLIVGEVSHDLIRDGEVLNFMSDGANWQLAN